MKKFHEFLMMVVVVLMAIPLLLIGIIKALITFLYRLVTGKPVIKQDD